MLKNNTQPMDLVAKRDELIKLCASEIALYTQRFGKQSIEFLAGEATVNINFPVDCYPVKIKSFNLDKQAEVAGILCGIKGQYLLLDTGVINIRKFSGYELEFLS
jgi:hypothetical protein